MTKLQLRDDSRGCQRRGHAVNWLWECLTRNRPDLTELAGRLEILGAQQIRIVRTGRSEGAVSRRRLPCDLAGRLCALRRYRRENSAGRSEVLERRPAGSLRDAGSGAGATSAEDRAG